MPPFLAGSQAWLASWMPTTSRLCDLMSRTTSARRSHQERSLGWLASQLKHLTLKLPSRSWAEVVVGFPVVGFPVVAWVEAFTAREYELQFSPVLLMTRTLNQ